MSEKLFVSAAFSRSVSPSLLSVLTVFSPFFLSSDFPLPFASLPLCPSSPVLLDWLASGAAVAYRSAPLFFFRSGISCEIVAVRMIPAAWQHLPPEAVLHCGVSTVEV